MKDYMFKCGGCLCNHCANNVDTVDRCTGEAKFACFNCEECYYYDHKGKHNVKSECAQYIATEIYAKKRRTKIKRIK
jgi:hypothetical protein